MPASTSKATISIFFDSRRSKKDNTSLVKLRVTYNRKSKYYTLLNDSGKKIVLAGISFAPDETYSFTPKVFKNIMAKSPQDEFLFANQLFVGILKRANNIAKELPDFSFEAFDELYTKAVPLPGSDDNDFFKWLEHLSKDMREEGRISTAVTYECALSSLKKFTDKESLLLKKFTADFLRKYESWMLKEGNSPTTTGIYLRACRVIFNKVMKKGLVPPESYPFGQRSDERFQIPSGTNIKKALTIQQVGLIANYKAAQGSQIRRYRDYWLFCYLGNGMNVKDMATLRYKNISEGKITFIREKTRRETSANPRLITVVITSMVTRIIEEWGNKPAEPGTYIFPILEENATPERQYKLIQQETKMINTYIAEVAKAVEIPGKVTTYVSRHSFATVLKRSGVSTEFIKESLGHSNLATTEKYLAGFEEEEQRKNAEKLIQF